jgi:hypothetical protein
MLAVEEGIAAGRMAVAGILELSARRIRTGAMVLNSRPGGGAPYWLYG